MAIYFFDSSGLVKRYVKEDGSAWVRSITDPQAGNSVYIAKITCVEVIAAFMRRTIVNTGRIPMVEAARAIADFRLDVDRQYNVTVVTDEMIDRAMELAETHVIRGYDAVQLAVALSINNQFIADAAKAGIPAAALQPLTLISADEELNRASVAEGLNVEVPRGH